MIVSCWQRTKVVAVFACASGLVACASNVPAPVIERSVAQLAPATSPSSTNAAELNPQDYYVVKQGDTLYSIALDHGQDYRDIAAWNKLENPTVIKVGQALRITPPEGVVVVNPIAEQAAVEVRPLGGGAGEPVSNTLASANTEQFKREPKGGKLPYSEQALALVQGSNEGQPSVNGVVTLEAKQVKSVVSEKPVGATATSTTATDGSDWLWPNKGKVIAGFVEGSNKGIDISGNVGDPVYASASGRVLSVSNAIRGYGNLIIIKHAGDYISVYAHNSKVLVEEKQNVSKGQKIAEVGNTDAQRPQLHFEIRRQGKPVDPMKFLPPR